MNKNIINVFAMTLMICILCVCLVANADYLPSYANDKNTREYKYEGSGVFEKLVLQEGDLDEDVFCQTIREITKEDVSVETGEIIEEITLDNDAVLHILVNWSAGHLADHYMTDVDIARMICCYITDDILRYTEIDQYWEKILFVYPSGKALLTKDMIVDSEYGRYFDGVDDIIK